MKPHRIRMAHNLVLAYGLYKKLEIYRPTLMSEEQMTKFHADDYIHFLQHVTPDNQQDYTTELTRYNLDVGQLHTHTTHLFILASTGAAVRVAEHRFAAVASVQTVLCSTGCSSSVRCTLAAVWVARTS